MADEHLTRRSFLKRGAGAVVVAGAAAAGGVWLYDRTGQAGLDDYARTDHQLKNYFAGIEFSPASPRLSVATGAEENIGKMVRTAVGALDPARGTSCFIAAGDVVLIKPNVGFDRAPQLGATTHPEVVRVLIRLCREAGAQKIIVSDNPIEAPEACFAKSGIRRVVDEEGAEVVWPLEKRFESLAIRPTEPDPQKGEALGRWPILYGPLAKADKVIGVAPIKDHNLSGASMNLKNWYGLLGGRRNQFHQAIHAIISDLAMMLSPTLVIADGVRVMMRNGPTGGRITDVAPGGAIGKPTIVASVDPVACDAWCCENLLGRDPARVAYLDMAMAKISDRIAAGERRFGESDWRAYQREGKIVTTSV